MRTQENGHRLTQDAEEHKGGARDQSDEAGGDEGGINKRPP